MNDYTLFAQETVKVKFQKQFTSLTIISGHNDHTRPYPHLYLIILALNLNNLCRIARASIHVGCGIRWFLILTVVHKILCRLIR